MLSLTLAAPTASTEDRGGFEPGFLTLFTRIASAYRTAAVARQEAGIDRLIAQQGGRLSDDVERRIGILAATGRV